MRTDVHRFQLGHRAIALPAPVRAAQPTWCRVDIIAVDDLLAAPSRARERVAMARVTGDDVEHMPARAARGRPLQVQFHADRLRFAVAYVVAAGIAEDEVVRRLRINGQVDSDAGARGAHARFEGMQRFTVQIGHRLTSLQSVQFRGLGRAKPEPGHRVELTTRLRRELEPNPSCEVRERIVAIGRSCIQAAAETAGAAVVSRVSDQVPVRVAVAVAFQTPAGNQLDRGAQIDPGVIEGRQGEAVDLVVVVCSRRSSAYEERGASGRSCLALGQSRRKTLEERTCGPTPIPLLGKLELDAGARLGVFLKRLAGKEVLQERHRRTTYIRRDGQLAPVDYASAPCT